MPTSFIAFHRTVLAPAVGNLRTSAADQEHRRIASTFGYTTATDFVLGTFAAVEDSTAVCCHHLQVMGNHLG